MVWLVVVEIRPHTDSAELGAELQALSPLVAELNDEFLTPWYREFLGAGEYYLALEVLVALSRVHPPVAAEIEARLSRAGDIVDPDVVARYQQLAARRPN
jgi:hypothetical protein